MRGFVLLTSRISNIFIMKLKSLNVYKSKELLKSLFILSQRYIQNQKKDLQLQVFFVVLFN
jgi:hypothetical protein